MTKPKPMCIPYAKLMAKQFNMSYADATKKYPRSCNANEVYLQDGCSTISEHCVHCARTEAMIKEEKRGDEQ